MINPSYLVKSFLISCVLISVSFSYAQEISVIDNKGTFRTVNNNQVTTASVAPANPLVDDVWFDTNTSPNIAKIWDGTQWLTISNNGNFWALSGNSGTDDSTNFLGTTDGHALILKSNNIEKLRIHATKSQVLINQAPTFNNHPLVIKANGVDVLAFQDNTGTPKWHWNLLSDGLNFVESNIADFRLYLENGGDVGINTDNPSERLDVNGKLRVRDIQTNSADQEILTTTSTGVVEKKPLIATETDNQLDLGANGGIYLGPTVYNGSFIISAPGGNFSTTFNQTINGLPFLPSQITFVAHANIESSNIDNDSGVGNNNTGINNSFGTMNGFVRNDGSSNTQQVIYIGGTW